MPNRDQSSSEERCKQKSKHTKSWRPKTHNQGPARQTWNLTMKSRMKCNCWSIYKTGNDLLYPCYIISVFSRFPANLYIQEWILILYWKKLRFTWCSNVLGRATSSRLRSCKSQAPSVTGRTWPLLVFEQENALRSECIPVIVPNSGAEISL